MNKCICGREFCEIDVGDGIREGVYRWYFSCRCDVCKNNLEVDGVGIEDVPAYVQSRMIVNEGEWGIYSSTNRVKIKYLVNKILKSNSKECNDGFVYSGTQNQIRWIKDKLIEKGIDEKDLLIKELRGRK